MAASDWLGLGPITTREEKDAFRYLRRHDRPTDRAGVRNFVARQRKRREVNRYLRGKQDSRADPSAPWQIIYGETVCGGVVTFRHTSGSTAQPHLYYHLIITVAAHEIYQIAAVYFDGYLVSWDTDLTTRPTGAVNATGVFAGLVKMQINYGTDSQAALSVPVGDSSDAVSPVSAKWTSSHRQRGHAHVYLRFKADETVLKGALPDVTFLVRGRYLTDPRDASSDPGAGNAAMVLYDYLTNARFGLGVPTTAFHSARLNDAVDDCEDAVSLAGGGTENRYLLNCHFTADEGPGAVVEEMLAGMAGRLVWSEGKYAVYAGVARTAVMTLTADMILSGLRVTTKTPRIDNFNSVRGTFVSTQNDYEESDFPAVTNATYVTQDGGEVVYEDLTLTMVTSHTLCQRLAKIELESARQGIYVELTCTLAAYQAEPGEWVNVTFPELGWSAKPFEVVRSALQVEPDKAGVPAFTVRLLLKETAAGVYDWGSGEETAFDLAPDTDLPNPFVVAAPTALTLASGTAHLYLRKDGTVFSRLYVSWTAAADTFVATGGYYEVQYECPAMGLAWTDATDVPGGSTALYILDVADGESYRVRVRAVNGVGARSAWVTSSSHAVVGKTAAPSDVTGFTDAVEGFGIKLAWAAVADLDVREYELRYGTTGQNWAAMSATAIRVRATSYYFKALPAGTTRFRIKAIDTSGNYSAADASTDAVVAAWGAVSGLVVSQIDNNILIDWDVPASAGTFPVAGYNVYKQAGSTTIAIGRVQGTFFTYPETAEGSYTYKVAAVDTAENEGTLASIVFAAYPPPDFALRALVAPLPGNVTLVNAALAGEDFPFVGGATILFPCSDAQTWLQSFTATGDDTVNEQVAGGYTEWMEPASPLTSSFEIEVDFGAVLPISVVDFGFFWNAAGGSQWADAYAVTVSWRKSGSDAWVVKTFGPQEVYFDAGSLRATVSATSFRYVKCKFEAQPDSPPALQTATGLYVRVRTKELHDSGTAAVGSSGTFVPFNKAFLDADAPQVTPHGTVAKIAVVDFTDVPDPTGFTVYLFDPDGNPTAGDVTWNVKGVMAVV